MKRLLKYITYRLANRSEEFKRATRADEMASFMWDFQQYLRGQWKYGDPPDDIEKIYDTWFEMMRESGFDLDALIS